MRSWVLCGQAPKAQSPKDNKICIYGQHWPNWTRNLVVGQENLAVFWLDNKKIFWWGGLHSKTFVKIIKFNPPTKRFSCSISLRPKVIVYPPPPQDYLVVFWSLNKRTRKSCSRTRKSCGFWLDSKKILWWGGSYLKKNYDNPLT